MQKIVVYTTSSCPYCQNAKKLLDSKKLKYAEIIIDMDTNKRDEMIKLSGQRTVPQIFINDKPIGGFDALSALNSSGQLDVLLDEKTS
ncbi:MAG: glutaredoxin 3 [Rickettsiella sp.]|nr:glutaredoxin 3 [Rickettsiella sp.]